MLELKSRLELKAVPMSPIIGVQVVCYKVVLKPAVNELRQMGRRVVGESGHCLEWRASLLDSRDESVLEVVPSVTYVSLDCANETTE